MKKTTLVLTLVSLMTILATPAMAGVKGGALLDSSKKPVKAGQDKCVVVANGKFSSACHTIKPRKVD